MQVYDYSLFDLFLLECCGITRESRATYVFFMVVLIPSVRIVSIFFTLCGVRLPTQGQDFVLVDKDCECIVSTRSVKIALISIMVFSRFDSS